MSICIDRFGQVVSSALPSTLTHSRLESQKHPIMADEIGTLLQQLPVGKQRAVHRGLPPRNEHGQMYCAHVNCHGQTQIFKTLGEWNKHMDRHERPYKCREASCELSPGFTYSGGLLRHQREVHKMHLSTNLPLFCPFPNCKRSSGKAFTRKENLEDHKRRRHWEELSEPALNQAASQPPAPGTAIFQQRPAKRRRISPAVVARGHEQENEAATGPNDVGVAESQLVQALLAEIRQKDQYILWLEAEIQRLLNLRSIPSQTIYGAMWPQPAYGVGVG